MANGQQGVIPVRPTVIVGLGGTGKEILLRLRMKFFERYSTVGYPCISYLWIDTDMQNRDVDRKEVDPLFQRVFFDQNETVDIQVHDPNDFLNNPGNYPNILEWMPASVMAEGLKIQNGAGQVRAKGRFSFFWNFKDIQDKLTQAITRVKDTTAWKSTLQFSEDKKLGLELDGKWGSCVDFFLASSLAGGTGSGTFLDAAFLLRQIAFETKFKPDITGLLLLSSLFTDSIEDRRFANCYAALKELEYYNFTPTPGSRDVDLQDSQQTFALRRFESKWKPRYPERDVNGPPFNTCYLIDGYTHGGTLVNPVNKSEVFDMSAEYLFWEFYRGAFAQKKRSLRPNNRQYLDKNFHKEYPDDEGKAYHTLMLSTGYSSFGLSWVSVPVGTRIGACAYRLAEEILEFWERGGVMTQVEGQNALRNKNVPQAARRAVADELLLSAQSLIEELAKTDQGPRFSELLDSGLDSAFQQEDATISACLTRFEGQYLARRRGAVIHDYLQPGKNIVLARYKEKVRAWVVKTLEQEGFIPLLGFSYLEQDGSQKKFQGYLDALSEIVLPEIRGQLLDLKNDYGEQKNGSEALRDIFVANAEELDDNFVLYKNYSRKILLNKCRETELAFATAAVTEWVCEEALTILEQIREYIDRDVKNSLKRFHDHILSPTIAHFTELRSLYSREEKRTLSLFLYEDLDKYYRLNGDPVDVSQEKEQLFAKNMPSLWDVITEETQWDKERLTQVVEKYGLDTFQNDFMRSFATGTQNEHLSHAVKLFNHKYPPSSPTIRSGALRTFIAGGDPYVCPNQSFGPNLPNPHRDSYLGLWGSNIQPGQSFLEEVGRLDGLSEIQQIETEKESVLYYTELTGFPLFFLSTLTRYRMSYEALQGSIGNLPCHIHKRVERFPDISIAEPGDARKGFKSWEIVIAGTILRVIQADANRDSFRYFYYTGRAANVEIIGDEDGAVKAVFNNLGGFDWCVGEIERRKREISRNAAAARTYYGLLQLYLRDVFPMEKVTLPDGTVVKLASFQSSVVERLIHEAETWHLDEPLPLRNPTLEVDAQWNSFIGDVRTKAGRMEVDRGNGKRDTRFFFKDEAVVDVFVLKQGAAR